MIQCPFKYASGGIPPSHSGKLDDPKHYCRRHRTAVNKRLLKKGKSADSNDRIWIPHSERIKKQKVSQEKKKKERVQPTLTREEFDALPETCSCTKGTYVTSSCLNTKQIAKRMGGALN